MNSCPLFAQLRLDCRVVDNKKKVKLCKFYTRRMWLLTIFIESLKGDGSVPSSFLKHFLEPSEPFLAPWRCFGGNRRIGKIATFTIGMSLGCGRPFPA